tara:strand:+ start:2378 stop:2533 length:156 start_codon:yes stop_codon:yes gene_type:complete
MNNSWTNKDITEVVQDHDESNSKEYASGEGSFVFVSGESGRELEVSVDYGE